MNLQQTLPTTALPQVMHHKHFDDESPLDHVVARQKEGFLASQEPHGTEVPGHMAAAADALRETALVLLLLWTIASHLGAPSEKTLPILAILLFGWLAWKAGRSALLGYQRLERLHRVMEQERWEIEHHRDQEREELRELYKAKGFSGKLLDDVVDVLMADGDRLLKVMLEEELGLSLESQEHPLKQALGAALGVLTAGVLTLFAAKFFPLYGMPIVSLFLMGSAGTATAYYEKNEAIPAVVWNLGLGGAAWGIVTFLLSAWVH
jgi:hypothetical protein